MYLMPEVNAEDAKAARPACSEPEDAAKASTREGGGGKSRTDLEVHGSRSAPVTGFETGS